MAASDALTILVVDDDPNLREGVARVLGELNCQVICAETGDQARQAVADNVCDLLILDRMLPDADGVELLGELRGTGCLAPAIIITAHPSLDSAVDALGHAACDYLPKPFKPTELLERVRHALQRSHGAEEMDYLWAGLRERYGFEHVLSANPTVRATYAAAARVATSVAPVLIQGETGTGKDYLARAIHYMSDRAEGHFVAVNCGALPDTLLTSELFGHEKGAFTSATQAKTGLCEVADGGTLFLDEIGEMSPDTQVKLLHFAQYYSFTRLGGIKPIEVDVRIIAATNQDLPRAVSEGRFREDLYYRLSVVPLQLPPLRERPEDVEGFARHFLGRHLRRRGRGPRELSDDALELLAQQPWPGNLRQLDNVIQRGMLMAHGNALRPEDLMLESELMGPDVRPDEPDHLRSLAEVEAEHIARALRAAGGDRSRAAEILGISPASLGRKLRRGASPDAPAD